MLNPIIKENLKESIEVKSTVLKDPELLGLMQEIADTVCDCITRGGKVIFAGNGGSFADSIHLAAEFVCRFKIDREPLPAISLGANPSIVSAVGNDYEFNDIFIRELKALGKSKDIFIAISTSGNSENIIRCIREAKTMGLTVYGLTGKEGGKMAGHCKCMKIPSSVTARIQEAHITFGHILCEIVETILFSNNQS
jgi:D-sedoheptulose 7-phosphate isomerase